MLRRRERELLLIGRYSYLYADHDDFLPDRRTIAGLWHGSLLQRVWTEDERRGRVYETSTIGVLALLRPAPPPKPGRVKCMNPYCTATAAAEKFPNGMICRQCFKSTGGLRLEIKELEAKRKKVERLAHKIGRSTEALETVDRRLCEAWERVDRFFLAPDKVEGLEGFLEEMGWADGRVSDRPHEDDDHRRERGDDHNASGDGGLRSIGDGPDDPGLGPWTGGTHWP